MIIKLRILHFAFQWSIMSLALFSLLLSCNERIEQDKYSIEFKPYGFHGYVGYDAQPNPSYLTTDRFVIYLLL